VSLHKLAKIACWDIDTKMLLLRVYTIDCFMSALVHLMMEISTDAAC